MKKFIFALITSFLFCAHASAADKIRVSVTNYNMSYLAAGVAAKRGFFKEEGLDVEIVRMGESSRALSERLKERPAFLGALSDMSGGKVVPVAGGVLIVDGSEIIGAVGVSGGTADEDEACAIEGIKAAGLTSKA